MDPLTTFGAAGDILEALDFCSKILSNSAEVYRSTGGSSNKVDPEALEHGLLVSLNRLSQHPTKLALPSKSDAQFASLNLQTQEICNEILVALRKIKPKLGSSSKMTSFRKSLRNIWKDSAIESLTKRVQDTKNNLNMALTVHM